MEIILPHLLWGGRKIVQIGQTEQKQGNTLLLVTRRRTKVRREAKFVQNTRLFIIEIRCLTDFFLKFCIIVAFRFFAKGFMGFACLVWCAHFATAPLPYSSISLTALSKTSILAFPSSIESQRTE